MFATLPIIAMESIHLGVFLYYWIIFYLLVNIVLLVIFLWRVAKERDWIRRAGASAGLLNILKTTASPKPKPYPFLSNVDNPFEPAQVRYFDNEYFYTKRK